MSDHNKLIKLLRLILLLSGRRKYPLSELKDRLDSTERTVYRYLDTLEKAGLVLVRQNGYRIAREEQFSKTLHRLFHFSEDEAYLLWKILEQYEESSEVKKSLMRKLHSLYDFRYLSNHREVAGFTHIKTLKSAMEQEKCVELKPYRSSNASRVSNRRVEPFEFVEDYKGVWAIDHADQKCKMFRLSRIGQVVLTQFSHRYREKHQTPFEDVFRMNAAEKLDEIHLCMTLKACNLLKEEYPRATDYIDKTDNGYEVQLPVAKYEGAARFVMGLPDQIDVMGSPLFQKFLKEKSNSANY